MVVSAVWDGNTLSQSPPLNTSPMKPFVKELTSYPCTGRLLHQRMCNSGVKNLTNAGTGPSSISYRISACPPTGFLNSALRLILRELSFQIDGIKSVCYLRQGTRGNVFAPVSMLCMVECNGIILMAMLQTNLESYLHSLTPSTEGKMITLAPSWLIKSSNLVAFN